MSSGLWMRKRLAALVKPFRQERAQLLPDLSGDRDIEWSYVAAKTGYFVRKGARVLDFGCAAGGLSFAAASMGASVLAIDLMPSQLTANYPGVEFVQTDVADVSEEHGKFDLILNCSTIEHVGLAGRYNSLDQQEGDLAAMHKLHSLMKPDGVMLLTLPIGRDSVFRPLHRIYGRERLPRLLDGYIAEEASFWRKDESNMWTSCSRSDAEVEVGSDHYYALGLMVLRLA